MMTENHERPTNVRWIVFALGCGTSSLLYLHRYAFALIKPKLVEEWDLTNTELGVLDGDSWRTTVYRRPGYPALLFDQSLTGEKGKTSLIPDWVKTFGEKTLHHTAILVDNITEAVFFLEKQGVPFTGKVTGQRGSNLRQVFAAPEMKDGKVFRVLSLVEQYATARKVDWKLAGQEPDIRRRIQRERTRWQHPWLKEARDYAVKLEELARFIREARPAGRSGK